jgi:hypothetical protein
LDDDDDVEDDCEEKMTRNTFFGWCFVQKIPRGCAFSLSFSLFYSYSRRVVYVDVVVVLVFDIILKGKILGEFLHFPNI